MKPEEPDIVQKQSISLLLNHEYKDVLLTVTWAYLGLQRDVSIPVVLIVWQQLKASVANW